MAARLPDPPDYYKKFVNGPDDLSPPDLRLLADKNYSLSFFNRFNIPVNNEN